MVIKQTEGGVCAPLGFRAAGVAAGIKKNSHLDLAMILSDVECAAAACFTKNKVKGAPILVSQQHLQSGRAYGILCNSGNANTCAPNGIEIAQTCCELVAMQTGLHMHDFIIASTGVIGQQLSLAPFQTGMPKLVDALSTDGSADAAQAIMTTDTVPKEFAVEFLLDGKRCHMGAIGKGSGMINPDMATMLVFITTDVEIQPRMLQSILRHEMKRSFNQLYIDGDTSTNDTVAMLASGKAGNAPLKKDSTEYKTVSAALHEICVMMCRALAADGEGATKLLECRVDGAPTDKIARAVAKSVIASNLFKSAMFGEDANWGRALCAIGYTPGDFSVDNVSLRLRSDGGEVHVCEHSTHKKFSEPAASRVLAEYSIQILVNLNDGDASGMAWGCDLTYDYVKINGDYRT